MREEALEGHPGMSARREAVAEGRSGGLLAIAIFKLLKSAFFFAMGLGAFHLMHRDIGEAALSLRDALHFDPEWRISALLMEKATLIDPRRLREIGFGTFAYSAIALTEGVGLMLEKVWAEYLTLSLTVAFLPWELYELARRPTGVRVGLLLINVAVLGYLLWLIERKRKTA